MGACFVSFSVFEPREDVPGQTQVAQNIIQNLLTFDVKELDKYFTLFLQIDTSNSGKVHVASLLRHLGIKETSQHTPAIRRMFFFYERPESKSELNFLEFVFCFWNFMTMLDTDRAQFIYTVAEANHASSTEIAKREMSINSVLQTLQQLEGGPFESGGPEFKRLRALYSSHITEQQFLAYFKENPSLLKQQVRLSDGLRKTVPFFGEVYFKEEMSRRKISKNLRAPRLLSSLNDLIREDQTEVANRFKAGNDKQFLDDRGKESKVKGGSQQKRRESKILNAFNLHPNQKLQTRVGVTFGGSDVGELQEEVREQYKKELRASLGPQSKMRKKSVVELLSGALRPKEGGGGGGSAKVNKPKASEDPPARGRRKSIVDSIRDSVTRKRKT